MFSPTVWENPGGREAVRGAVAYRARRGGPDEEVFVCESRC